MTSARQRRRREEYAGRKSVVFISKWPVKHADVLSCALRYNVSSMSLRVYNTLSNQKEPFEPVHPGKVGIYLCGPTVYKPPHVGHMVGPVIFDAIKRYLQYKGFDVTWVVNITDVDDKLIDAATKQNTTDD